MQAAKVRLRLAAPRVSYSPKRRDLSVSETRYNAESKTIIISLYYPGSTPFNYTKISTKQQPVRDQSGTCMPSWRKGDYERMVHSYALMTKKEM